MPLPAPRAPVAGRDGPAARHAADAPRSSNPVLDAQTIVQILLETPAGIANVDAIASIDGVDMVAIGANDLTAELGAPGTYDHPAVREAVASAAEACHRHGKLLMLGGIGDLSVLASLSALGTCPLLLTGMDTDLLFSAARSRVETLDAWHDASARTDGPVVA